VHFWVSIGMEAKMKVDIPTNNEVRRIISEVIRPIVTRFEKNISYLEDRLRKLEDLVQALEILVNNDKIMKGGYIRK